MNRGLNRGLNRAYSAKTLIEPIEPRIFDKTFLFIYLVYMPL
nr:MAG TPA: hypothetical protein [Caudoviricetes sp.]